MYQISYNVLSFRCLAIALLIVSLSGCSYLFGENGLYPNRSNDYLKVQQSDPITIPEDKVVDSIADNYPIPELKFAKVLPKKYEVPRVDSLNDLEPKGSVKLQSFKSDQWVLVKRSPGQIWPLVLQFFESNQIPLVKTEADRGVIETDWLKVNELNIESVSEKRNKPRRKRTQDSVASVDASLKERYQLVLKPGIQKNSTEIWVKQSTGTANTDREGFWTVSSSALRQENMAYLVAEHLAGSPDQSSHSLLAQGIGSASKVSLEYSNNGDPYLDLQLSFDRGWAALQSALEKASFEIEDLDRSNGIYYTRYIERKKKEKKPGYLKRMYRFIVRSKKVEQNTDFVVKTVQQGESLIITLKSIEKPLLESNEQAFMLRKILNKLS